MNNNLTPSTGEYRPSNRARKLIEYNRNRNQHQNRTSADLHRWTVIVPRHMKEDVDKFMLMLIYVSRRTGFHVQDSRKVLIDDDEPSALEIVLDQECNMNPQMILVCISDYSTEKYNQIRIVCSARHALPSQVVTHGSILDGIERDELESIAVKVANEMYAKIGGLPRNVDVLLPNCMFIGYDVCCDSIDRSRSFGALVAMFDNTESNRSKFFTVVSELQDGQKPNYLLEGVMTTLSQYRFDHQRLPSHIVVHRSGVGDDGTNYDIEHELAILLNNLRRIYRGEPKLGFAIVSEKNESQNNNQGVSTSTKYTIMHNKLGLTLDQLEEMTFKICQLNYNYRSDSISIPVVCQYANKLAAFVGNYLHRAPVHGPHDRLYFL